MKSRHIVRTFVGIRLRRRITSSSRPFHCLQSYGLVSGLMTLPRLSQNNAMSHGRHPETNQHSALSIGQFG